ncbi:MAG: LLM class flavin-dependent oxidoreductase [Candidatus Ranarchaeia archaeon]
MKGGRKLALGTHIIVSANPERERAVYAAKKRALWSIAYSPKYILEAAGLEENFIHPVREALPNLQRAMNLVTEKQLAHFAIVGTPKECAEKINAYEKAGVDILAVEAPDNKNRLHFFSKVLPEVLGLR